MFLKIFRKDEGGIAYTVEAILGVALILGMVIFVTGNLPYTAQKSGEHSKVQLMNIGRDSLDLLAKAPIKDWKTNFSQAMGVYRQYNLTADKKYVKPGEPVNFTVYYLDTNQIVYRNLTLEQTILGLKTPVNTTGIYGSTIWSFDSKGDYNGSSYNIRAFEGPDNNPTAWSNYVTIKVGDYFLESDIYGISYWLNDSNSLGDWNVTGIVYDSSGNGVSNLNITILDSDHSENNVWNGVCAKPVINTVNGGNFSFIWPADCLKGSGSYYLRAINSSNNLTSDDHRIIYSDRNQNIGTLYPNYNVINETESMILILNTTKKIDFKHFNVNQVFYKDTGSNPTLIYKINLNYLNPNCNDNSYNGDCTQIIFTGYTAGDYYIFYGNVGYGGPDPAQSAKTNGILIRVNPFPINCLTFDDCNPPCSALNFSELSEYMRRFIPYYVNYNMYLIDPDGKICKDCPEFKELLNGYPTDEAAAVSKPIQIKTKNAISIKELRMVLWYK